MSDLKTLRAKIEVELKGKSPSASKIMYEVEQLFKLKADELEKLTIRCRNLERKVKENRYAPAAASGKFETPRSNRPSFDRADR